MIHWREGWQNHQFLLKIKILFGLATFLQNLSYFMKGFTSVCLKISTRYKAIFIITYFDLKLITK